MEKTRPLHDGKGSFWEKTRPLHKKRKYIFEKRLRHFFWFPNKMPKKCRKEEMAFYCSLCDFGCSKRSNYDAHLATRKHGWKQNGNKMETEKMPKTIPGRKKAISVADFPLFLGPEEDPTPGEAPETDPKRGGRRKREKWECGNCGKEYTSRSGVWKHRERCGDIGGAAAPPQTPTTTDIVRLMMDLVKENQEIKELLLRQNEKWKEYEMRPVIVQQQITNHAHISLNVFLEEKCKAAINMSEFVRNLNIGMGDLEMVGRLGFVEGISRIIVNELSRLDIYSRPIHCTDIKRETIYIKDQDEWKRDTATKEYTKQVIEKVANKNLNKIPEWRSCHPEAEDMDTEEGERSMNIMIQSLGGLGGTSAEKTAKNQEKIIKTLSKIVFVDKDRLLEG